MPFVIGFFELIRWQLGIRAGIQSPFERSLVQLFRSRCRSRHLVVLDFAVGVFAML